MPGELILHARGWHQENYRWYLVTVDRETGAYHHWPLPAGWGAPWEWID